MHALNQSKTTNDFVEEAEARLARARAIEDAARSQGRALTDAEMKLIGWQSEAFDAALANSQRAEANGGSLRGTPLVVGAPQPRSTSGDGASRGNWGFTSHGDFVRAVAQAKLGRLDQRLVNNAVATYGSEGTSADGGYAIPPDFRLAIQSLVAGPDSIFGLLDPLLATSGTVTIPTDEDPPWSAAGIQAAQVAEGTTPTSSKPVLKGVSLPLAKYTALVFASEEILADGAQMGDFVLTKAAAKLGWKLDVAAYQALVTASGRITTAKGATSAGASPSIINLQAAWQSFAPAWRRGAVWLINPACESDLQGYALGGWPKYLEAGVDANEYPTLFGARVLFHEACAAKGTEGDVILFSPRMVYGATRTGTPAGSTSIDFAFDQDLVGFKVSTRARVAPKLSAVVTRPDSTTVAPIVTVATR